MSGHKVDAIRRSDKASFCVIEQDDVQPEKYTTFFRSVIAFGRIHIIEDEAVSDVDDMFRHRAPYGQGGNRISKNASKTIETHI